MATIAEELSSLVAQLPPREQERVLTFARELISPPAFPHTPLPQGNPPDALLRIRVDPAVGEAMAQALAECELVDADE